MNPFRKCRLRAGLRQEAAAAALEVDRSTIAKWETGIAKPRADKLNAIAKLYDCSISELLEEDYKSGEAV